MVFSPTKFVCVCTSRRGVFFLFFFLIVAAVCADSCAIARQGDFDIRRIEYGFRIRSGSKALSGGLSGLNNLSGFPQKWGVITVHYSSQPAWADDVTLKYYVMVRNQKRKNSMFTGSVTYISVASGWEHQGLVFLHPNSLSRYGTVKRILVEIWYQGILVDSRQWPNEGRAQWWNRIAAIQGALRCRFFTPFEHDYEVNEEDIKVVIP